MSELLERLQAALADRYLIARELGRGGMATVYLAEDRKHQRRVALKVLRPEIAQSLGGERFLQEIRLAAQLNHPHILALHDSGETEGMLWYTMPYVEGESLRDRLNREEQLPLEDALCIAKEVADGLEHAHRLGVIHRDIKPENILLANGHATIADFGIAKAVSDAGGERLTETGIAVGTPAYMSPEQGAGSGKMDGRSDLYSLACVLYEMLAGEPPYTGTSAQALMAKHVLETRPYVRTLRDTVPGAVQSAIRRAMAKSPADRFRTVDAFVRALSADGDRAFPFMRRGTWRAVAMVALLAGAAYGAVQLLLWGTDPRSAGVEGVGVGMLDPNRIAVLYFEDLSAGDLGHVARGLTEDLIRELSWVDALHVTSPEGVRPFRNRDVPVDSIGTALAVGSIVGGSVARSQGQLRVRVRLLDPATGEELFSRTFQDGIGEVFALQDRLADEVARFLRERLGREIVLRERRTRMSQRAWELLNRGEERADEGSRLAREGHVEQAYAVFLAADSLAAQAAEVDPAWNESLLLRSRIAYSLAFVTPSTAADDSSLLEPDWLQRALGYAEQVLSRDPTMAQALAARGELRYRIAAWTSPGSDSVLLAMAERDLESALDREPGLAGAWYALGELQYRSNRFPEANRSLVAAYQADAYLTEARTVVQLLFFSSLEVEEFEDARRWCDTGRRRFQDDPRFVDCEITLLGWSGRGAQHIAHARSVLTEVARADTGAVLASKRPYQRIWIAALYARTGMTADARAFIDSAHAAAAGVTPPPDIAHIEAYVRLLLGQTEAAARLLADFVERHPNRRPYIARSPWFRTVRAQPEFSALLAQ